MGRSASRNGNVVASTVKSIPLSPRLPPDCTTRRISGRGGLAVALLVVSIGFPLMNNVFIAWGVALYVFSRGTFVVMGIPLEKRARGALPVGEVVSNA